MALYGWAWRITLPSFLSFFLPSFLSFPLSRGGFRWSKDLLSSGKTRKKEKPNRARQSSSYLQIPMCKDNPPFLVYLKEQAPLFQVCCFSGESTCPGRHCRASIRHPQPLNSICPSVSTGPHSVECSYFLMMVT